MYEVSIKDHIMIAHSFDTPDFGPAQRLHGATYVVEAIFSSDQLDKNNTVIDIGKAHEILAEVLAPLAYRNLDDMQEFSGQLTTTEFMARHIHDQICKSVKSYFKGQLKVKLDESHVAWASYAGEVK